MFKLLATHNGFLFTFQYGSTYIRTQFTLESSIVFHYKLSTSQLFLFSNLLPLLKILFCFLRPLIFLLLSTYLLFYTIQGRQSQKVTQLIIFSTPHFFRYPPFVSALKHNQGISIIAYYILNFIFQC